MAEMQIQTGIHIRAVTEAEADFRPAKKAQGLW